MHAASVAGANLKTPKAAAIAGIVFSILLLIVFSMLRLSLPADPLNPGAWLQTRSSTIALALNMVPFAGIAFLWFMGVLRDRLGRREDRFVATVFFGSGLLFLGMLFVAAAIIGAIMIAFAVRPEQVIDSATLYIARATAYNLVNIYMIKMAAVFMITTSTLAFAVGFLPRWLVLAGYGLALLVLVGSYSLSWSFVVFPVWVFLVSTCILMDKAGRNAHVA
jgi:MFS family permease